MLLKSTLIISMFFIFMVSFTRFFLEKEGFNSGGSSNTFGGDDILQTSGLAFSPILPPEFLLLLRLLRSSLVSGFPSFDTSIDVKGNVFDGLRRILLPDLENACAVVELMARLGGCGVNCGVAPGHTCNIPDGAVFAWRLSLGLSITGVMVISLL